MPEGTDLFAPRLQRWGRQSRWSDKWIIGTSISGFVMWAASFEMRTSMLQSQLFSRFAQRMTYTLESGPSPSIVFPREGPFDRRHGYSQIPEFQRRLESKGFEVTQQACFSPWLQWTARLGIAPPYREPMAPGLVIRSAEGLPLYVAGRQQMFKSYDEIPSLVVEALLLMENRELGEASDFRSNPVLEWDRLAKAGFSYLAKRLGFPVRLEGGSTLATQLEKYRHSCEGRTHSVSDKLRQMISACLKAYRRGTDTRQIRREIVVDYLNSMPLAAVPAYGEVHGVGPGLREWFGASLSGTCNALRASVAGPAKALALKRILYLLAAVRAPSYYLVENRAVLEDRVLHVNRLLTESGLIAPGLARQVAQVPVGFSSSHAASVSRFTPAKKATHAIRKRLAKSLAVGGFYELDRLDLQVKTTVDAALQKIVIGILQELKNPEFLDSHGFRQMRLLANGDPNQMIYSFILLEKTPRGNVVRVQTDTWGKALDINEGIKMELGSTAKLRTLAHYLELVALTYREVRMGNVGARMPKDPITLWVTRTLAGEDHLGLDEFLQLALDRTYSASPYEAFFTGGGRHTFHNFDSIDNDRRMTVREATYRSTNLVFIRLMRDLVRFHQARLSYDAEGVLTDLDSPVRRQLLDEAAEEECRLVLFRSYNSYRNLTPHAVIEKLLGEKSRSRRQLAMLFFAWHPGPRQNIEESLSQWFQSRDITLTPVEARRWCRAYGNPKLNLKDFGYLMHRHPLELWCAGEMMRKPQASWDELWDHSGQARQMASSWLYETRHRRAQDIRLRIQIERDAFERMTPYWQRLGFPFSRMVPSYATAIGNSSDRPVALAELMGIIMNDGKLCPMVRLEELRFASNTPYHTVMVPSLNPSRSVMAPAVAHVLKSVLAGVVEHGTARRLDGALVRLDGAPIPAGGKTGSGDNRFKSFGRDGTLLSSRAANRTAAFVFYIGDRYFGVVSAAVLGKAAESYTFTSALPVAILKLLAHTLNARLTDEDWTGTSLDRDSPSLSRPIAAGRAESSSGATLQDVTHP